MGDCRRDMPLASRDGGSMMAFFRRTTLPLLAQLASDKKVNDTSKTEAGKKCHRQRTSFAI